MLRPRSAWLALAALAAVLTGCGGGEEDPSRPAPSASAFPSAQGKTIDQVLEGSGATPSKLVVAPAAQAFVVGANRYPFGIFTAGQKQIADAEAALYVSDGKEAVQGPLPARVTSLETKPAYRAQGSEGPGEAKVVYVVPKVDFDHAGKWIGVVLIKGPDGLEASRVPTPVAGQYRRIPRVGQKAPIIHTPTAADVGGDLSQIDTRVPPDQMHEVDFADVAGKQPIVLVFATPALCQSRVCGPVVDVAQEVADEYQGRADFIHMEVYDENDPAKGLRPQLQAYGLPTEPWTFLIDRDGVVRDRIEGAYGVDELEAAMKKIVGG